MINDTIWYYKWIYSFLPTYKHAPHTYTHTHKEKSNVNPVHVNLIENRMMLRVICIEWDLYINIYDDDDDDDCKQTNKKKTSTKNLKQKSCFPFKSGVCHYFIYTLYWNLIVYVSKYLKR